MNELVTQASNLWATVGLLAGTAQFQAIIVGDSLVLIVDMPNVGRKQSIRVRQSRRIPLSQASHLLPDIIPLLYRDTMQSVAQANNIGVKF